MNNSTILIRHGTAEKNKIAKHGGAGTPLTLDGVNEIDDVAHLLIKNGVPIDVIYSINRPQCIESSSILSNVLNVEFIVLSNIEPFNLGVLDGLTENQSKTLYPDVSMKMEQWRDGKIDITQLNIPESTDPVDFINRCKKVLEPILNEQALIVGTRSILVAFASILLDRHPVPNGGYVEIPWNNAAFTVFRNSVNGVFVDNRVSSNIINSQVMLKD